MIIQYTNNKVTVIQAGSLIDPYRASSTSEYTVYHVFLSLSLSVSFIKKLTNATIIQF